MSNGALEVSRANLNLHISSDMEEIEVPNQLPPVPNTPVDQTWCYTHGKLDKFSYTWAVRNFSFYYDEKNQLESPAFSTNDKSTWCLKMDLGDPEEDREDYLSLFLHLVSGNKSQVRAKYQIFIINDKKEKVRGESSPQRFFYDGVEGVKSSFGRYFLLEEENRLLPNDRLTILCEGSILTNDTNTSPEDQLPDILGSLFENPTFSDVTLVVNGRKFQVHKAILAARSSVFSELFEQDTKEKKLMWTITHIDHEVLGEMLRFIYTGKVENLEKIAEDLFTAADQYELEDLKTMCEEVLSTSLELDNVIKRLIFADHHNAKQLKSEAINFIIINASYVMAFVEFESLIISHPNLIAEAFQVATQQIQSIGL